MDIKKYLAEAIGTFVLVLFGCGTATFVGCSVAGCGYIATALAFGLAIVAMAFVIGDVSGCHVNPAVSLACYLDGRMKFADMLGYWIGQFIGGIAGAFALALIVMNTGLGSIATSGLGCNGFEAASASNITMAGAIITEIILTCVFTFCILGVTKNEKTAPFAGIIIGLCLVFVHILGIALTGTSVNPARSFGPALAMMTMGGDALAMTQVWVFILAPLMGAALSAGIFRLFRAYYPSK